MRHRKCNSVINARDGDRVEGNGNIIRGGPHVRVVGDNNSVMCDQSHVDGNYNTVRGSRCTIKGTRNSVFGDHSKVFGTHNKTHGRNCTLAPNEGNKFENTAAERTGRYIDERQVDVQSSVSHLSYIENIVRSIHQEMGGVGGMEGRSFNIYHDGVPLQLAGLNGGAGPAVSIAQPKGPQLKKEDDRKADPGDTVCKLCSENMPSVVLKKCGHAVMCRSCYILLKENAEKESKPVICPICRAPTESYELMIL